MNLMLGYCSDPNLAPIQQGCCAYGVLSGWVFPFINSMSLAYFNGTYGSAYGANPTA